MTRADRTLVVVLALVAALAWPVVAAVASHAASEVVISSPSGTSTSPLSADAKLTVDGILGPVVVSIEGGAVRVVESGCPDQVCVRTGAVRTSGSVIACVPNGVVVRVGGGGGAELDARLR